ncbi:MAG: tail protein X [Selenomonadaceae bacterium]|nr:tail protein X [Selenomonadaceae bacterium]MBR4383851.1 tail protein X [Selenomonadaceae bacterium]
MMCKTRSGDTWDLISYRELGSCRHTEKLINKNRKHVDTLIFAAGVELELPDVTNERKSALPPWRTEAL